MLGIGLAVGVIFGTLFGIWLGKKSPNGYPVLWKFHPAVKEGYRYVVRAIYSECLSPGISLQRCASLQDEGGLYKPFQVFFPSKEECDARVGDLIQPIWCEDEYILCLVSPNRAMAC